MSARIRKIKIINNTGAVNVGDYYNVSPVAVQKTFAGSGGSSIANFLNGQRQPPVTPRTPEFLPPVETSEVALGR
ncbi:spore germination protein [Bacillus pseudomycoides]|uniref:Spore germination protein n=1 Tax=Bacillus pseudomycoides TaxID=64104 RepID=A0AA91VED2_9BACI|nr:MULTISPECIES: spore germination protein [Bacillus]PEB51687.1 spore germination protein [Bacillus sp. AFS098217]PED83655.1 spore germination protein [Bacillus pseudomycoides]PEU12357.1 spore germination protein [Bacillus sp. AFS019443]PEU21717.1 spore germination protein [Bacillus sp. AFS014408]PFW62078.1 spore germination protein [Bacillus sp. AFS075034]